MDEHAYPTKQELKFIKNFQIDGSLEKALELIEYIREIWMYADCGYFTLKGKKVLKLELHTGGWSGNEDIIEALIQQRIFWALYWVKSTRGGHYWFEIKVGKGKKIK